MRHIRQIPQNITKDLLIKLYISEHKSCLTISREINKSIRQVSRYLQRFGIKARPFSTKGLQTRLGAVLSKETKEKIRQKHLGKKLSEEHRIKVIKTLIPGDVKGEKSHGWRGGVTSINARIRSSKEIREWKKKVLDRDKYQCVKGGKKHGDKLEVDHIAPFAYYPELRFSVDNGRTLCVKCHRKTETYGNKKKNNIIFPFTLQR